MKIHRLAGHIQNLYLVEYPRALLLLDGGCRADLPLIQRFVEQDLARSMAELKLVVVTHMHPDHAGGANQLKRFTSCQIACADVAGQWYAGIDGVRRHLLDLMLAHFVAYRQGRKWRRLWYSRRLQQPLLLEHQQTLPGFADWQVLFTPGHTDRDISLYHAETGICYVADTILRVKGKLVAPFPVSYPQRYRDSLTRLEQLPEAEFLFAHGEGGRLSSSDFAELAAEAPLHPSRYREIITGILRKTRWGRLLLSKAQQ